MRRIFAVATTAVVIFSTAYVGCGPNEDPADANQQQNDNQKQNDNGQPNGDPDNQEPPVDGVVNFFVQNDESDTTIPLVDVDAHTDSLGPDWVTIYHEGEPWEHSPNCLPDSCDGEESFDCTPPDDHEIVHIEPGEREWFGWDGMLYRVVEDDEECTEVAEVAWDEDVELEAEFCIGDGETIEVRCEMLGEGFLPGSEVGFGVEISQQQDD